MEYILSYIFSGISLIIVCVSCFVKNKTKFLFLNIFSNIFYAASLLVIKAYVGGVNTIISIFRCLYLFLCLKYNFKYTLHFLTFFFAAYITSGILLYTYWFDFLPILSSSIFTIAYCVKDMNLTRKLMILPRCLLITYSILTMTYLNAVLSVVQLVAIIVSMIKHYKESPKSQQQTQQQTETINPTETTNQE